MFHWHFFKLNKISFCCCGFLWNSWTRGSIRINWWSFRFWLFGSNPFLRNNWINDPSLWNSWWSGIINFWSDTGNCAWLCSWSRRSDCTHLQILVAISLLQSHYAIYRLRLGSLNVLVHFNFRCCLQCIAWFLWILSTHSILIINI